VTCRRSGGGEKKQSRNAVETSEVSVLSQADKRLTLPKRGERDGTEVLYIKHHK
jgi:hypothetical protein